MSSANYDTVGQHYARFRQADPRIAALIHTELEGAISIINIGAGAGSYEPVCPFLVALDPSEKMLAQRNNHHATAVRARAEQIPFRSDTFDMASILLSIHHWDDWRLGLQEATRVTKSRIVLFTWVDVPHEFWLYDYIPALAQIDKGLFPSIEEVTKVIGPVREVTVPVPADCKDGFLCAYWNRPQRYLDAETRSAISTFSRLGDISSGLSRLSGDLKSGRWPQRYAELLTMDNYDFGYRLLVSSVSTGL